MDGALRPESYGYLHQIDWARRAGTGTVDVVDIPQTQPDEINIRFGRNLRWHRVKAHLTVDELSEIHGLSNAYLNQIENGQIEPPISLKYLLCRTLNIQLHDLYAKWKIVSIQ